MPTPLIPQEIYLLERYSSAEYFDEMRQAWISMLNVAETALQQYMLNLPPDYRNRHLSQQPDTVWGERVLPNFRSTRESLDGAYIQLLGDELAALGAAYGVSSDARGQTMDYPANWMSDADEAKFYEFQGIATKRASNIAFTEDSGWYSTDLTSNYHPESRGPLNAPYTWPTYRLNNDIKIKTEEEVKQSGIYLPECNDSCASLMVKGAEAWEAEVGYDPKTTHALRRENTTWTLVERIADSGGGIPGREEASATLEATRIRVEGGQTCPQAGWYFTPVQSNSRRLFKKDDVMPSLAGDYGVTIWQWDADQSAPNG